MERHSDLGSSSITSDGVAEILPRTMKRLSLSVAQREGREMVWEGGVTSGEPSGVSSIITTYSTDPSAPKESLRYRTERVVGNGSFGVVYMAKCIDTNEVVAIKKVLQDKRFKNRELQIIRGLQHPNIVQLKHCFYSAGATAQELSTKRSTSGSTSGSTDDIYLNLVLEFVPDTVYKSNKMYIKSNQSMPLFLVKLYSYQMLRAIAYIHSQGICHRDIKPQNLLVDVNTHALKLCDFGSAKKLRPDEANISYICSRYYRAPELIFGATNYTTAIDVWSVGCVAAELLLGHALFPGDSGVDQLVEIIKVLGTPSREEIHAMNPNYTEFKFPSIKPTPWSKVFGSKKVPQEGIDLVACLLVYDPRKRLTALEAMAHPFFDELRKPGVSLPNGKALPPLSNWLPGELEGAPKHIRTILEGISNDVTA